VRWAVTMLLAGLLVLPASASAQSSSFSQLSGESGCILQEQPVPGDSEDQIDGCGHARGLLKAFAVAVSPDDKHVYVASSGAPATGSNAVVAFSRAGDSGALTQVGCVSDSGGDGRPGTDGFCANGDALLGADGLAVSPDGRDVYVASHSSNGIAWLSRDAATGKLAPAGCIKNFPRADRCRAGFGLEGTSGVAVSPDGRTVYVTADTPGSITAFSRDPGTGSLEPLMCVSETGSDGLCTDGTALAGASSVTVAPDGREVFVTAAGVGGVTSYARAADGALTPQGCLLDKAPKGGSCTSAPELAGAAASAITPDGKTLVVASQEDAALALFARDADTGAVTPAGCVRNQEPQGDDAVPDDLDDEDAEEAQAGCKPAKALYGPQEVVVSPDGRGVFALGGDSLAAFSRDPGTGELTQTGCAEEALSYKSCSAARGLFGARGMAVSSDARSLYTANEDSNGVLVFSANVAITSRVARVDRRGRFRVRLACPAARVRGCAGTLRVGAARTSPYRLRAGASRAVRARLPKHLRRAVRKRGHVRAKVRARDSRRLMHPAARRVLLRRR
jgi:6-phosphogluconolactonase (cycloisomerase 2 family)